MARKPSIAGRTRRLLAIIPLLHGRREVPLAELAAAVGASEQEVHADILTLSMCGIPPFDPYDLFDVAVSDGMVRVALAPAALERPVRLTPAEAHALVAALQAVGYTSGDPLLGKVAAAANAGARTAAELAARIRSDSEPGGLGGLYAMLATAVEERETLAIVYFTASRGATGERRVRPARLFSERGVWYLSALDEGSGARRTFRLDRIREARPTGERFEPLPAEDDATPGAFPASERMHMADVRFDADAVPEARDWPQTEFEPPTADGSVLAHVRYDTPTWLARQVAATLGHAEVLAPAEARAAVSELANELLANLEEQHAGVGSMRPRVCARERGMQERRARGSERVIP